MMAKAPNSKHQAAGKLQTSGSNGHGVPALAGEVLVVSSAEDNSGITPVLCASPAKAVSMQLKRGAHAPRVRHSAPSRGADGRPPINCLVSHASSVQPARAPVGTREGACAPPKTNCNDTASAGRARELLTSWKMVRRCAYGCSHRLKPGLHTCPAV